MSFPPISLLSEVFGKSDVYSDLDNHFKSKFDHLPKFYVRVPGRVNLIGEHIDYCGFSVLPMGIEQDIVLAVSLNDNQKLSLTNLQSDIYDDFSAPIESFTISSVLPKWYDYFLCGVKGISENHLITNGMNIAVRGTVPPSSGLSSSSALVCAAALATAYANKIFLPKLELASICAKCECYIGTQGGGMDQAIAFLAESGTAKLIKFNPLEAIDVKLPDGACFIVANSCVPMNKGATAHYNTRVVECRLAAKILAKWYDIDWQNVSKLKDICDLLEKPLNEICSEIRNILHSGFYTSDEICELLDISMNEFKSQYLSQNTQHLLKFKLLDRACHVFDEALRVEQFKAICESNDPNPLQKLGKLMIESHTSCRDLYECSHPELDELVEISLGAGALGSRLTGAGWGGSCISLVSIENVDTFLEIVKRQFFFKNSTRKNLLKSSLFASKPGGGAAIYLV